MPSLAWYGKRLSVMSRQELAYRVVEQMRLRRLRKGAVGVTVRESRFWSAPEPQLPPLHWQMHALCQEKDRLLDGRWHALAWPWRFDCSDPAGFSECWHRAPDTQRQWPLRFFADVPHREDNPVGDARVVWEPARLQQLVALSALLPQADTAERSQALHLFESTVASWVCSNPAYSGVHYISAMECALRILALCYAFDGFRLLRPSAETCERLNRLVCEHAWFIAQRLSRYSSAGNHTLAEAAGLVFAGALLREQPEAERWLGTGMELLRLELPRQVLADGGSVEQSHWYLLLAIQLGDLAQRVVTHVCREQSLWQPVLERGYAHLRSYATVADELLDEGDADGGFALSEFWDSPLSQPPPLKEQRSGCCVHAHSGRTSFRFARAQVVFDHGPLGMAPGYGHGHADALSVRLAIGGVPVLIDPGTFTYTGSETWRRYFRGTSAHNTVVVDGCDQADHEGPFLWSRPFCAQVLQRSEACGVQRVLASHSGYVQTGCTHIRLLQFAPAGRLLIADILQGTSALPAKLHWHVHPSVEVQIENCGSTGGIGTLKHASLPSSLRWTIGGVHCLRVVTGQHEPPLGWYSRTYGAKQPTSVLCADLDSSANTIAWSEFDWSECHNSAQAVAERESAFEELLVYMNGNGEDGDIN